MSQFSTTPEFLLGRRNGKWTRYDADVLPAWVAEMDFPVAEPIQQAMQRLVEQRDYGYPWRDANKADLAVANAFVDRMRTAFGWQVEADAVQVVAELVQATFATILAYSEPGDGVILQTPAYPPFHEAIHDTGRRLVDNPMVDRPSAGGGSRFELDFDGMAKASDDRTRVMLLCHPQNPTGRVFSRQELERLGRFAIERDLVIVSDEIHSDLLYPGHAHIPMATISPEIAARTVTLTSPTKSFNIPGLRCAVMHFGTAELMARFHARMPKRLLGQPGIPGIDATVVAWRDCGDWFVEVKRQLLANRDRLTRRLAAELPEIRYHEPESTFLAWLDCRDLQLPTTAHEFFLEKGRVALNAGETFGPYPHCVRLNFATTPAILDQILDRMVAAVRRLRPSAAAQ